MATFSEENLKRKFEEYDTDKSGCLSVHELKRLLLSMDSKMRDFQVNDTFIFFEGPEGDKKITMQEFINGMNKTITLVANLKALFDELDQDQSGYLDKNEIRTLLKKANMAKTEEQIDEIIADADSSGDGKIGLGELIAIFC